MKNTNKDRNKNRKYAANCIGETEIDSKKHQQRQNLYISKQDIIFLFIMEWKRMLFLIDKKS